MKQAATKPSTIPCITKCAACNRIQVKEYIVINKERHFAGEKWYPLDQLPKFDSFECEELRKECPDLSKLMEFRSTCPDCAKKQAKPMRRPFFMSLIAGARKLLPFRFSAAA